MSDYRRRVRHLVDSLVEMATLREIVTETVDRWRKLLGADSAIVAFNFRRRGKKPLRFVSVRIGTHPDRRKRS